VPEALDVRVALRAAALLAVAAEDSKPSSVVLSSADEARQRELSRLDCMRAWRSTAAVSNHWGCRVA